MNYPPTLYVKWMQGTENAADGFWFTCDFPVDGAKSYTRNGATMDPITAVEKLHAQAMAAKDATLAAQAARIERLRGLLRQTAKDAHENMRNISPAVHEFRFNDCNHFICAEARAELESKS